MSSISETAAATERHRAWTRQLFDRANVLLSPMAGVSDRVFRSICRDKGADVTYCEFVSAQGLLHGNKATLRMVELGEDEHPVGIQLYGCEPHALAEAARQAAEAGPDLIDLNFGCPVKKVVKKKGGSALLCDVPLMEDIVRAVVAASPVPVTAKIRTGWDRNSLNYLEVTRMLEESGVCAVTCHGRTRDQRFGGSADWGPIAEMKAHASIPVIGNGDVTSADDFLRMRRETGCDAVMIARAAIGNPWIFTEIQAVLAGEEWAAPTIDQVVDTVIDHLDREIDLRGEQTAVVRMRRQMGQYLKGLPRVAELRKTLFQWTRREPVVAELSRYREAYRGQAAAA